MITFMNEMNHDRNFFITERVLLFAIKVSFSLLSNHDDVPLPCGSSQDVEIYYDGLFIGDPKITPKSRETFFPVDFSEKCDTHTYDHKLPRKIRCVRFCLFGDSHLII